MNRLTDRQLAEFYFGLARHYDDCVKRQPAMTTQAIYDELYYAVHYTLNYSDSPLRLLPMHEQQKAYTILNTFFYACPQYQSIPQPSQSQRQAFFQRGEPPRVVIHEHHYYDRYYSRNDDVLFTWVLLNSLAPRPAYYYPHAHHSSFDAYRRHNHHHHHPHAKEKKQDEGSALALLLILAIILLAALLAFVAMYYVLRESLNSLERFFYNEGWMQAGLSLISMAAGATAASIVTAVVLYNPLTSLAMAAGFASPVGLLVFSTIALALVGAAATNAFANAIQQHYIKKNNSQALDPSDPHRFSLNKSEEQALIDKGLDPVKIKCAMVAIRAQMGNDPLPSLLNRWFTDKGQKIQEKLHLIRELKRGELQEVQVGDMRFNCRLDGARQDYTDAFAHGHGQQSRTYQKAPVFSHAFPTGHTFMSRESVQPSAPPFEAFEHERLHSFPEPSAPPYPYPSTTLNGW